MVRSVSSYAQRSHLVAPLLWPSDPFPRPSPSSLRHRSAPVQIPSRIGGVSVGAHEGPELSHVLITISVLGGLTGLAAQGSALSASRSASPQ
ncbi:uncharacterized protein BO72DRAFT_237378 [Aspergillus fijiensis CBS 313.89]|uniref:Uncharacterized protein n=1 Tax=Aspergillus fijiensis CBS 313.89 TaxID=1448319 RepID=A0A8G1S0B2_9EURO|nr:uncharacterized protein BO72DRAFT_237378 [Aspergillus fijiensis CBS 313.89]RAK81055.1 hypothetical protein BO72DRAFT_237378 [Aspergillus fijiensis CBS 313.89]